MVYTPQTWTANVTPVTAAKMNYIEAGIQAAAAVTKIADVTLASAAANIDLTSIPTTFAALRLLIYAKSDTASAYTQGALRFNNDSSAVYSGMLGNSNNGGSGAATIFSQTQGIWSYLPGASVSYVFASYDITIPNPGANLTTAFHSLGGELADMTTGSAIASFHHGLYAVNAPITRITLYPTAGNFATNTRISLYGLS